MKPLRFTVKKLYNLPVGVERDDLNLLNPLAYQLTPEGVYLFDHRTDKGLLKMDTTKSAISYFKIYITDKWGWHCNLYISEKNPTQPFLVPAEHYESFKQAVHEYNMKYCDVPDVKVLDDFVEWCEEPDSIINPSIINTLVDRYKATLCNKEQWFEMEGNDG